MINLKNGRLWLKKEEAKEGLKVELDSGFTCHPGGVATIHKDEYDLYFTCAHGIHYIDGQFNHREDEYIGITIAIDQSVPDAEVTPGYEYEQE